MLVPGIVGFSRNDSSEVKKGQWKRCHSYLMESGLAIVAALEGLLSFTALVFRCFTA